MSHVIKEGLTFDDLLLVPKYSTVKSRKDIDLSVKIKDFTFSHPIIPANMKTVTGEAMAIEVAKHGGLAILHRFMPNDEQLKIFLNLSPDERNYVGVSLGVQDFDRVVASNFIGYGVKIFCIDIAHGDSKSCIEMIKDIKEMAPDCLLIAGNVATASGAESLWIAGADVVKVGIGPGSLCTTRIETGNGVPQLTALMDVYERRRYLTSLRQDLTTNGFARDDFSPAYRHINRSIYIIADGGIKSAGDIVKALCFSDMVMAGNLFAGCNEAPGTIVNIGGRTYKEYVGSSTHKGNHVEGVAAMVDCKGPYSNILTKLTEGLRSGCSYQGAHNLDELRKNPQFIKISSAGLRESHPHDVTIK